jgi:amino acid adenylation domain-containing protein
MHFASMMRPESSAEVWGTVLAVGGDLCVPGLERALTVVRGRHDALRATFLEHGGDVLQVVHDDRARPVLIDVVVAEGDSPDERRKWADAAAERLISAPFDVSTGPLWRASVIRLSAGSHLIVFGFHHLIIDEISMQVFADELRLAYADPEAAALLEPAVQYADLGLETKTDPAALEYWQHRLAGIQPARLPEDGDEDVTGPVGSRAPVVVPERTMAEFEAFCQARSITAFTGMLAVYYVLLQRWAGMNDIPVGTQVLGRPHSTLFGTIGFFANTVVLRCPAVPTLTFDQFLSRVDDTVQDALEYQDAPFDAVVDALAPQRDADHNPLFQVAIAYGTLDPDEVWALDGLSVSTAPEPTELAGLQFGLTLDIRRLAGETLISVEYDRRRFSAAAMGRFADAYASLLGSLIRTPQAPLAGIPMLDGAALTEMLALSASIDPPDHQGRAKYASAWELFEQTAAAAPEREAVVAQGERLTFADLEGRARAMGAGLRARGVRTGTVVGICLPRSVDLVATMLATWNAGGAFLLLDPQQPQTRSRMLLQEADAALLVTNESFTDLPAVPVSALAATTASPAEVVRPVAAPAYVCFTSGSTGKPKGVVVDHEGLVALAITQLAPMYAHLPPGPVNIGGVCALTFDVFINHILAMIAFGHRLLLLDDEERTDPRRILERGSDPDTAIEVLDCSSGFMETLVESGLMDLPHPPKILQIGGEGASDRLWQRLHDQPGLLAFNAYGVTECTVESTMVEVGAYPDKVTGRAVGTTRIYIVDDHLQLLPPMFVGEVCIGGLGVAQGYVGQPGYTSERFIADPFTEVPGRRMYRTGDKARLRPDGQLEFWGRIDDQVKVHGLRIEPGELEVALCAHPAITRAAVVVTDPGTRVAQLVAYVVPGEGDRNGLTRSAVREFLRGRLPSALLPDRVEIIDSLPITRNGKVDRKALSAVRPPTPEPDATPGISAPADSAAGRLSLLVADVVGVPQVSLDDNFFLLGGNSLLAMQLISRIRTTLGGELSSRAIFESETIADLAAQLTTAETPRPVLRRRTS